MAEPFNWPTDDKDLQAIDLEQGTMTPAEQEPASRPLDDAELAVAPLIARLRGQVQAPRLDVLDELPSLPRETIEEAASSWPTLDDLVKPAVKDELKPPARDTMAAVTAAAHAPLARKAVGAPPWMKTASAGFVLRHRGTIKAWRPVVNRWALPALIAVVVIESAWMVSGGFGMRSREEATTTTPAAPPAAVTAASASPTAGGDGAEGIKWQAALAENAAALKKLQPNSPSSPVTAGSAATPAASPAPLAVSSPGTVAIALPFQVEVYENGRFVGISDGKALPLTPGSHRLELVNDSLKYRATQVVSVNSGRTTQLPVALPAGTLQLNATPWAEVFVDGRSIGETPLGNVQVPIGPHTLVFRHPQLGEQTRSVVVLPQSSNRIGVDLQK